MGFYGFFIIFEQKIFISFHLKRLLNEFHKYEDTDIEKNLIKFVLKTNKISTNMTFYY